MNYKELVQGIYPDTSVLDVLELDGVIRKSIWKNELLLIGSGSLTEEEAWENAWENIQRIMLRKLEL